MGKVKYKVLDGNLYALDNAKSVIAIELKTQNGSYPYIYTNRINFKILKLLYIFNGFHNHMYVDCHRNIFKGASGKRCLASLKGIYTK